MSANNWTGCPKCVAKFEEAKAKALRDAEASYGKVSPDEYRRLIAQAEAGKREEPEDTMREDYEIGMEASGHFSVGYSASCTACGFRFRFKHERNVLASAS